jgi:hypothetical protein
MGLGKGTFPVGATKPGVSDIDVTTNLEGTPPTVDVNDRVATTTTCPVLMNGTIDGKRPNVTNPLVPAMKP